MRIDGDASVMVVCRLRTGIADGSPPTPATVSLRLETGASMKGQIATKGRRR
jgi:hypothetical protein